MLYPDGEDFSGPVFYMLVCKVVLGQSAKTATSPPTDLGRSLLLGNRRDLVPLPGSRGVHYHSLLAELPAFRYREFVSFHSERMKPVYLVAYTRDSAAKTKPARAL